jgi:hypothetical protein
LIGAESMALAGARLQIEVVKSMLRIFFMVAAAPAAMGRPLTALPPG